MLELERFYTSEHVWVRAVDGADEIELGITEFYQDLLGEITYVNLPEIARKYQVKEKLFSVESMKSATEFSIPLAATVTRINTLLEQTPQEINHNPFETGWICQLKIAPSISLARQFMSESAYETMLDG